MDVWPILDRPNLQKNALFVTFMQNVRPVLDNPNLPVHDGTYFDCLENVTEGAKVIFQSFI